MVKKKCLSDLYAILKGPLILDTPVCIITRPGSILDPANHRYRVGVAIWRCGLGDKVIMIFHKNSVIANVFIYAVCREIPTDYAANGRGRGLIAGDTAGITLKGEYIIR